MQLNKQLPGLPEWPPIVQEKDGYAVGGPHVSYRRYVLTRWLCIPLVLGYVLLVLCLAGILGGLWDGGWGAAILIAVFLAPLLIFMMFFPASRLLCQWFLPRRTLVRFTPRHIVVNNQRYDNTPDVSVQFRANRPYLTEGKYYDGIIEKKQKGNVAEGLAYELKFRKIEMIYGSRIIPITSVADEDRAAQFAIALQLGYEMAGQLRANPARNTLAKTATAEDTLPE